jgi:CheY-like chemotaxis protein
VRRLFLDGLGGFIEASVEPGRIARFFSVLVNELRSRGVTTLYTMETRDVVGPGIELPVTGISSIVENLVALRYVEHHARSRRLLSVVKVRGSGFDPALREFVIAAGAASRSRRRVRRRGGPPERLRARPARRGAVCLLTGGAMTTVLVVDDEALIAMALEAALEDAGYRVATAANGRQGLERLAEAPRPEIVLLDMMMPVMNGPAMLAAMAADPELRGIPVIVLSSLPEEAIRDRAGASPPSCASPTPPSRSWTRSRGCSARRAKPGT